MIWIFFLIIFLKGLNLDMDMFLNVSRNFVKILVKILSLATLYLLLSTSGPSMIVEQLTAQSTIIDLVFLSFILDLDQCQLEHTLWFLKLLRQFFA